MLLETIDCLINETFSVSQIRKDELDNIKAQRKQLMSPKYVKSLVDNKIKAERMEHINPTFRRQSEKYDQIANKTGVKQTYL